MRASKRSPPRIHELTIRLSDVEPTVWRRLRVSSGATLERVARVFAVAMGWTAGRPYAFTVGALRYEGKGARGEWRDLGVEVRLRQLLPDAGSELEFEYGNGHAWHLMVRVERVLPPDDAARTPLCVSGEGSTPPVDVGGPWAYEEWRSGGGSGGGPAVQGELADLDGVAERRHPRVRFNPDVVNAELDRLKLK